MSNKISIADLPEFDPAEYLEDETDILLYLKSCTDQDPGDGSLIRAALGDIVRARNIMQLSKETGISRAGLYKAFSGEGNPSFATVLKVAHALGLKIDFQPVT